MSSHTPHHMPGSPGHSGLTVVQVPLSHLTIAPQSSGSGRHASLAIVVGGTNSLPVTATRGGGLVTARPSFNTQTQTQTQNANMHATQFPTTHIQAKPAYLPAFVSGSPAYKPAEPQYHLPSSKHFKQHGAQIGQQHGKHMQPSPPKSSAPFISPSVVSSASSQAEIQAYLAFYDTVVKNGLAQRQSPRTRHVPTEQQQASKLTAYTHADSSFITSHKALQLAAQTRVAKKKERQQSTKKVPWQETLRVDEEEDAIAAQKHAGDEKSQPPSMVASGATSASDASAAFPSIRVITPQSIMNGGAAAPSASLPFRTPVGPPQNSAYAMPVQPASAFSQQTPRSFFTSPLRFTPAPPPAPVPVAFPMPVVHPKELEHIRELLGGTAQDQNTSTQLEQQQRTVEEFFKRFQMEGGNVPQRAQLIPAEPVSKHQTVKLPSPPPAVAALPLATNSPLNTAIAPARVSATPPAASPAPASPAASPSTATSTAATPQTGSSEIATSRKPVRSSPAAPVSPAVAQPVGSPTAPTSSPTTSSSTPTLSLAEYQRQKAEQRAKAEEAKAAEEAERKKKANEDLRERMRLETERNEQRRLQEMEAYRIAQNEARVKAAKMAEQIEKRRLELSQARASRLGEGESGDGPAGESSPATPSNASFQAPLEIMSPVDPLVRACKKGDLASLAASLQRTFREMWREETKKEDERQREIARIEKERKERLQREIQVIAEAQARRARMDAGLEPDGKDDPVEPANEITPTPPVTAPVQARGPNIIVVVPSSSSGGAAGSIAPSPAATPIASPVVNGRSSSPVSSVRSNSRGVSPSSSSSSDSDSDTDGPLRSGVRAPPRRMHTTTTAASFGPSATANKRATQGHGHQRTQSRARMTASSALTTPTNANTSSTTVSPAPTPRKADSTAPGLTSQSNKRRTTLARGTGSLTDREVKELVNTPEKPPTHKHHHSQGHHRSNQKSESARQQLQELMDVVARVNASTSGIKGKGTPTPPPGLSVATPSAAASAVHSSIPPSNAPAAPLPDIETTRRMTAYLDRKDAAGYTALLHAIWRKQPALVPLLLGMGANVQTPDSFGNSPLHLACLRGLDACIIDLLSHGARLDAANAKNKYPFELPNTVELKEVVRIATLLLKTAKQYVAPDSMATSKAAPTASEAEKKPVYYTEEDLEPLEQYLSRKTLQLLDQENEKKRLDTTVAEKQAQQMAELKNIVTKEVFEDPPPLISKRSSLRNSLRSSGVFATPAGISRRSSIERSTGPVPSVRPSADRVVSVAHTSATTDAIVSSVPLSPPIVSASKPVASAVPNSAPATPATGAPKKMVLKVKKAGGVPAESGIVASAPLVTVAASATTSPAPAPKISQLQSHQPGASTSVSDIPPTVIATAADTDPAAAFTIPLDAMSF